VEVSHKFTEVSDLCSISSLEKSAFCRCFTSQVLSRRVTSTLVCWVPSEPSQSWGTSRRHSYSDILIFRLHAFLWKLQIPLNISYSTRCAPLSLLVTRSDKIIEQRIPKFPTPTCLLPSRPSISWTYGFNHTYLM
jgi:hypothetical protein